MMEFFFSNAEKYLSMLTFNARAWSNDRFQNLIKNSTFIVISFVLILSD